MLEEKQSSMILTGRRHDGKDVTERCSTTCSPVDGAFLFFNHRLKTIDCFQQFFIIKLINVFRMFFYFPDSVSLMINMFKGENIAIFEACMIRFR